EVEPSIANRLLQKREIGRAAADIDVVAVRRVADRMDLGAALDKRLRGDAGVGAVRAVDGDAQPRKVGAEPLEDVRQVGVGGDLDVLDAPEVDPWRGRQQSLDLLLRRIRKLVAPRVEELDAV